MKTKWKFGFGLIAMALLGMGMWTLSLGNGDQFYEVFEAGVERSTIRTTIAATGQVEAMVTVLVGSQVTGQVQTIFADFNSVVTEGQLLAQLDPRHVETQLRNGRANLRSAESRILTAQAERGNADADLESARANLEVAGFAVEQAELDFGRASMMFADGLVSLTELEQQQTNLRSARAAVLGRQASLEQAGAQIISRDAAIEQAYAALEQAGADLEEAELNFEYTTIRSPIDGVVISREVDVGQTVSASTSAPTLFIIAHDLSQMRLQASIDEADIGLLGHSNPVTFTVDAYADHQFEGRIQEIRLNPSTSQNVVTYSVIVVFDNPALRVKPGMTANILITVDQRDDVLTVPNTALRYLPPNATEGVAPDEPQPTDSPDWELVAATVEPFDSSPGDPDNAGTFDAPIDGRVATRPTPGGSTVFMAGQEWQGSAKIQFQAPTPAPPGAGRVWIMAVNGIPELRHLIVGMTDGSRTEVVSGDLKAGDLVLIGDTSNLVRESASSTTNDQRSTFRALSGGGGFGQ